MANSWYDKGLQNFAAGNLDWDADNFRLVGIDEDDDVPNLTTDDNLDDITAGARVGESGNFAAKTTTDGYLDADNVTVTSVSGDQFESFSIFLETGVDSTSILLLNFDTATGLPLTPDGGNITYVWQGTAPFIARL
jgi:hypothetical protein